MNPHKRFTPLQRKLAKAKHKDDKKNAERYHQKRMELIDAIVNIDFTPKMNLKVVLQPQ